MKKLIVKICIVIIGILFIPVYIAVIPVALIVFIMMKIPYFKNWVNKENQTK